MNLERLGMVLQNGGFAAMRTNKEEIKLYCLKREDTAYILVACDFQNGNLPDISYVQNLLRSIRTDERFGVSEKELLLLVHTDNLVYGKYLIQEGIPAWIVDATQDRLMVYEEQSEDFAGIRKPIEAFLEGKPVRKKGYLQISPINTVLVAINVLLFFLMTLAGAIGDNWKMVEWGAMFTPFIKEKYEYYRLFTAMFLHFDVAHLTGNMIILIALGDNLERALGKIRYLILYLMSGLGASVCSCLYNEITGDIGVAAGASGAIFGVIGALFCMALINKGKLEDITAMRLGMMIVYILYTGFTTPHVDNAAHIGGLLTGMILTGLLHIKLKNRGRKGKKHED